MGKYCISHALIWCNKTLSLIFGDLYWIWISRSFERSVNSIIHNFYHKRMMVESKDKKRRSQRSSKNDWRETYFSICNEKDRLDIKPRALFLDRKSTSSGPFDCSSVRWMRIVLIVLCLRVESRVRLLLRRRRRGFMWCEC